VQTPSPAGVPAQPPYEPQPPLGDQAAGAALAGTILAAATNARWPMYLRNAKQIFRQAGFDERRYGLASVEVPAFVERVLRHGW